MDLRSDLSPLPGSPRRMGNSPAVGPEAVAKRFDAGGEMANSSCASSAEEVKRAGSPSFTLWNRNRSGRRPAKTSMATGRSGCSPITEDVEDVQAYLCTADPLGTGSEGDEVPAEQILHL